MSIERLSDPFSGGRKVLVSYMMVGYPDFETSIRAFEILIENGSDIVEVGYPFSDPVADGPTIQVAHERALENGIRFKDVLAAVGHLRRKYPDVPLLLMTYYNPIFKIGLESFIAAFAEAGIDGFIVPDLPPEESAELKANAQKYDLATVMLASPTSTPERLKKICNATDVFTYYVSVTGITGERDTLPLRKLKERMELYRSLCDKKVVVGFGISKSQQARAVGQLADGVVVGSHFVKLAGKRELEALGEAVGRLKAALEQQG